ncbi:MAG: hypothetical protein V4535_02615 [Bacteroidota bacterium]
MENNESLFNEIKSAAENAETKHFPGMEKVWNRVEEKLDNKEDKKAVWRWKKIAVAASLLLIATLGYQFFKTNQNDIKPSEIVTSTDTIKRINPTANPTVISEPVNPAIKKDAEEILHKQIKPETQVAMEAKQEVDEITNVNSITQSYFAPSAAKTEDYKFEVIKEKTNDIELFMDKSTKVSNDRKEEPLVVIENKVVKKKLENIEFDQADSLVVLKEPLYIINGIEFSEQEVFGPNPTSPYTPLNKQEIETLTILQDEKAIEQYGKKGSKGVVIITTKNRKPVTASKKAK